MKRIRRACEFFGLIGEDGDVDWVELAFIGTIAKFLLSSGMDSASIVSMVGVIIAKMHQGRLDNSKDD